ncbi:hypothetical protein EVAR_90631_1 [Eumeta japonica]|uniref:Uncharacterized protein n=1 Tax=Eumeta variegata TaxID=151549 RepID=A0A4C1ZU61_EUMVA|nr:hypothetical protein EVAR_90631_1 [Eumeta japonica]
MSQRRGVRGRTFIGRAVRDARAGGGRARRTALLYASAARQVSPPSTADEETLSTPSSETKFWSALRPPSSTVAASAQSVPGPNILVHSSRIPQPTPFKMPKTRSKTAQRSSNGDTDQQQSSEGTTTEASSATTTTTTATTTTEGNTDRTTTTDTSTENRAKHHKHIQTTSRFRSHQICTPHDRRKKEVNIWKPRHYRRTASENGTTGKTAEYRRARDRCQDRHATCSLRDLDTSRVRNRTEETDRNPDSGARNRNLPTQHSRPEHIAPLQSTGNMIELATALTRARGRPAVRTTYQRFMAHIKNGSCSASYVDTRTSFTEHENMLSTSSGSKEGDRYIRSTRRRLDSHVIDSDLAQQLGARGRNEPYT